MRAAPPTQHNAVLCRAAYALGQLVGAGLLDPDTARTELTTAARACLQSERRRQWRRRSLCIEASVRLVGSVKSTGARCWRTLSLAACLRSSPPAIGRAKSVPDASGGRRSTAGSHGKIDRHSPTNTPRPRTAGQEPVPLGAGSRFEPWKASADGLQVDCGGP